MVPKPRERDLQVNAICTGSVETPMTANYCEEPGRREVIVRLNRIRRFGPPKDIANPAVGAEKPVAAQPARS